MNPYTKAASVVIRLIGFGFVAVGLLLLAGDLFLVFVRHEPGRHWMLGLEGLLLLIGGFVLWKSTDFAKRLTQDFEE